MAVSPDYLRQLMLDRGLPPHIAEGFLMNFGDESGFDPGINEIAPLVPGSRGGFGLYQLTGPRRRAYEAYASQRGVSLDDPAAQIDFMMQELQGDERRAAGSIFAAKTPQEAAIAVARDFLRPSSEHLQKRIAKYGASSGVVSGGGGDDSLAGQAASDDLSDIDAFLGVAPQTPQGQQTQQPETLQPAPQTYKPVGPVQMQAADLTDLADIDAFLGIAPQQTTADRIAAAKAGTLQMQPGSAESAAAADALAMANMTDETGQGGFMRGLGLGTRSVAQGLAGTAGLIYDPIAAVQNYVLGTEVPPLREQASAAMTGAGVPSPQTPTERVIGAITEGGAGAVGSVGAGRALVAGGAKLIGDALASGPVQQFVGGLFGGGAAQAAAEMGGGTAAQLAAGLGGAVAGAGLAGIGRPTVSPQTAETVAAAERAGIKPMTSDVFPPDTFAGRSMQRIGEIVPLAGTGGVRASQQDARVKAVRDLARYFGADADASDDVMKGLLAKRGDDLKKYTTLKADVIDNIGGTVPVDRATAEIDTQVARLRGLKTAEVLPVISKLEDWKRAIQGQDLKTIEELRKQFGEAFADPSLASVRSAGQKALSSIYGALREDMGDHIKANGQPRDYTKWRVANTRLSEMMGELDNASLKSALAKGNVTPERIRGLLFSAKPSDVKTLYKNLNPEGRARARSAVVQEAITKATDGDQLSPQKFRSQLVKMGTQVGVFFGGDDLKAVDGLRRVLDMTSRAGESAAYGPTGVQTLPVVGGMALTDLTGSFGMGAMTGAAMGLTARAGESRAVRNLLMAIAKTEAGSKEEAAILKRIMEAIRAEGAAQEGPQ